jgi:pilus assembly protein Flp/PilA
MFSKLQRFLRDESGPTAVEYAVMLSLIVVVCLVSIRQMANATADSFDTSANEIAAAFGS